jgi:hypothetical protein
MFCAQSWLNYGCIVYGERDEKLKALRAIHLGIISAHPVQMKAIHWIACY